MRISAGRCRTPARDREVMTKPHPVYAQFQGKKAYGIRRIAVISPRLRTAVEKCDVASKSADARDKARRRGLEEAVVEGS